MTKILLLATLLLTPLYLENRYDRYMDNCKSYGYNKGQCRVMYSYKDPNLSYAIEKIEDFGAWCKGGYTHYTKHKSDIPKILNKLDL